MNALVKIAEAQPAVAAADVLTARAEARADLWWNYQIELQDAVNGLQDYARQTGLIEMIGQKAVQAIIAEPFAQYRNLADAAGPDANELSEAVEREIFLRAAELVQRWEIADPRDRWQHTGEAPPKISATPRRSKPYQPAASTVAAFNHLVSLGDRKRMADWLRDHPNDAPALLKKAQG